MRTLIIGGTGFVGRHLVLQGVERGHEITLYNRGRTSPELFDRAAVTTIVGDRAESLEPLAGGSWDVVIDTCGYVPRVVDASARALANSVDRYVFISTLAAYADHSQAHGDESAVLATIHDPETETIDARTYGALKALCEGVVTDIYGDRALHVRPGLIVGPDDHTDRFTYWPVSVATQRQLIAPPSDIVVEFTDVRDVARWTWVAAEAALSGAFDVSGPTPPRPTFGAVVAACQDAARATGVSAPATVVHVTEQFLLDQGVTPWQDLPLWVRPEQTGFATRTCARAIASGLTFRPLAETVRDTLDWAMANGESARLAGLDGARVAHLLERWTTT